MCIDNVQLLMRDATCRRGDSWGGASGGDKGDSWGGASAGRRRPYSGGSASGAGSAPWDFNGGGSRGGGRKADWDNAY